MLNYIRAVVPGTTQLVEDTITSNSNRTRELDDLKRSSYVESRYGYCVTRFLSKRLPSVTDNNDFRQRMMVALLIQPEIQVAVCKYYQSIYCLISHLHGASTFSIPVGYQKSKVT